MDINSYKCPNCGAEITFRGSDFTECPYCRSQIVLDGIADKAELERLRREKYELKRSGQEEFTAAMKKWKRYTAILISVILLTTMFGFLSIEYLSTGLGVLFIVIGFGLFLVAPLFLGTRYPSYDGANSRVVYLKDKVVSKTLILYGVALFAMLMGMIIAAMIAVAGEESEQDGYSDAAVIPRSYAEMTAEEN